MLKNLKIYKKIHISYGVIFLSLNAAYLFFEVKKNGYSLLFDENKEYYFAKMQEMSNILYPLDDFLLVLSVLYLILCKYLYKRNNYGTIIYLIVSSSLVAMVKIVSLVLNLITGDYYLIQSVIMVIWVISIIATIELLKNVMKKVL